MRIAIIGLGGVGGYICASLNKTSHEIVGFARGEHLRNIQENGLEIIEDDNSWNQKIDARELSQSDGYFDIVVFCVKSYDLEESYKQISKCIDSKTILFSISNGVNNGELLKEISSSMVLDACVYILSHIQKAGVIRKKGKLFALVLGGEDTKATDTVLSIFDEAKLRYKLSNDIKTDIWKKYIFISAFATLTSYYNKSIGYIYEYYKDEANELLTEISNVAKSKNIFIDAEIEKALQTASKLPYDSSTSMHLDFVNKKRVEIDSLSGYIVNEGLKAGVKTPLMSKMYEKLKTGVYCE